MRFRAVDELLPRAESWSNQQWRWIVE